MPDDPAGHPPRQWHVPSPGSPSPSPVPAAGPGAPRKQRQQAKQAKRAKQAKKAQRSDERARSGDPGDPRARPSRRRRRGRRWVLFAVVAVLALLVLYGLWIFSSYRGIDSVDLGDALDPVTGDSVNYLLVGSDSRENLDPEAPDAEDPTVTGRRADTIILLSVGPEGSLMMSIPRDLWVTNAATGSDGRINGSYNDGPANLVNTVKQNLSVPVNHYAEVDFASFAGLVDAVGGVTVDFPHPAYDPGSGLDITTSGPVTLDGTQALAYVRSRNYTEVIDGQEVKDPTADLGRQQRQQEFLVTALSEVGGTRNPYELGRAAAALSGGLTVDSSLGFFDAISLARRLGGGTPETVVLPTEGARIGGASVLLLVQDEAESVLDRFR